MSDVQGININEIKNMSKIFLEYRDNISKIFNEYKRIIDNSKSYFNGEAATLYRKKFDDFYDKLELVINSFTEYSDQLNSVINKYSTLENNFMSIGNSIIKKEIK